MKWNLSNFVFMPDAIARDSRKERLTATHIHTSYREEEAVVWINKYVYHVDDVLL